MSGSISMHGHEVDVGDTGGSLGYCILPPDQRIGSGGVQDLMRETLLTPGMVHWSIRGQELHLSRAGAPTLVFTTDDPLFPVL